MSKGLNIIVFGMPGAGKSALLGALWQASQSQPAVLGGTLADASGGLAELHGALYAQQPAQSAGKLAGYSVALDTANGAPLEATLVDCDGAIAEDFLAKPHTALHSREAAAKAMVYADALLLLVDPTAGGVQLEKEFLQFCTLVQSLEKLRSHRSEVAGLPIYLVLTKCDMLAKPTDTGSAWIQKIEEGKRKLDKRFQEFLDKMPNREALPFGKVDVRVWATAVKRPQLADRPAAATAEEDAKLKTAVKKPQVAERSTRSQEPYGVAELFRQCFEAARAFQHNRKRASEALQFTLLGFSGLIALMLLAAGLFVVIRPNAEITSLESKIREAMPGQKGKSTDLLKEPLDKRVKDLDEIMANPVFDKVPSELQQEVKGALAEIGKYRELNKEFVEFVKEPRYAKSDEDLVNIEKELDKIKLPDEYKDAWKETKLVKKEGQFRQDIDKLRLAVKSEEVWIREQIEEGKKLRKQGGRVISGDASGKEREAWFSQVKEFMTRQPRHKETEPLDEKAPTVRYSVVYRFPQVERAQLELRSIKKNVEDLVRQAQ